mgnify:CR=1 FL=1|tara:strand:- start:22 stop:504 length:483 start_codon:yes stop_codon:yes gene_type:complete
MSFIVKNTYSNFVHSVDTSFTSEAISAVLEFYPGTEVTYTPQSGASKVIYECSFQSSWQPDSRGSYANTRLQYSEDGGSTWTTIDSTRIFEGNFGNTIDYVWHQFHWKFVLDTWSGERKLRLAGRSAYTTSEYTVGASYNVSPAGMGVGSCPQVTIYSLN